MTYHFSLILCLFVSLVGLGQEVQWIPLDQAEKLNQQTGKPIIILEENHDRIVYLYNLINKNKDYINEHYLPVKIKTSSEDDKIIIKSQIKITIMGYMSDRGFKKSLEINK
tara:strand:+ start:198 stop:530 length:333 start_codon:yes stop_codon:yes gene_type:complete